MKIFNTLTKKLEEFVSVHKGKVNIYLCGPTVYDVPHLGHGRSVVCFDFLRRFLIYLGYEVNFVSNYTDIDDKIINRAAELDIPIEELVKKIIPRYVEAYSRLKVLEADVKPKATEYVAEMIKMIHEMVKHDIAYKIDDGWYFDIKKFKKYGALKGQALEDLKAGVRVDVNSQKRNVQDFVLWKLKKEGEPFWEDDLLDDGRPGWHIECSAMIRKIFDGEKIDIHGGGEDLIFPHHDCEIAQSECLHPGKFVKYWMHNAFVMVNNEKMSKSLNNFSTLDDLYKTNDPLVIRFFYLQAHYRKPVDFHDQALEQAKNTLKKINLFWFNFQLHEAVEGKLNAEISGFCDDFLSKFKECLENDLRTDLAIFSLHEFIGNINKYWMKKPLTIADKEKVADALDTFDRLFAVLNLNQFDERKNGSDITRLIEERSKARAGKNYVLGDEIRKELKEKYGVELLDRPDGKTVPIFTE